MIGLGSLVRAFFFLPTPRSVLGLGWSLFARLFAFLPSRRPPHSVRGHSLGNRAAKQRHGTGFPGSFFFCVILPTPSSAPSRGGGQGNLATHSGTGLYVLSSFVCDARFVFSFDMRFRLGTSSPLGIVGCAPPATMIACGTVMTLVSLVFAPVLYFNSPFFVSRPPPRRRYAGGFRRWLVLP